MGRGARTSHSLQQTFRPSAGFCLLMDVVFPHCGINSSLLLDSQEPQGVFTLPWLHV